MRKIKSFIAILFLSFLTIIFSCEKENKTIKEDTPPATTPYTAPVIANFRPMPVDAANPMTLEGIALGKRLFFDPILSKDSTISCASCHQQQFSFSDDKIKSLGVNATQGKRNSMALINLAWQKNRFFWDGHANTLRQQATFPIEDPLEMHLPLPTAIARLQKHADYVELFWKAFGTKTISVDLLTKALEQFENTLISYNSKYDLYVRMDQPLTTSELNGLEIFKTEKGDCFHCHASAASEVFISPDRTFANNGLDAVNSVFSFTDFGLGTFTRDTADYGRFKIPTLRNLAFTAPYMHDGRFATLDEVIDFYNAGPKLSPTLEPIMIEKAEKRMELFGRWGLGLTAQEKQDLKAFLLTLTDTTYIRQ